MNTTLATFMKLALTAVVIAGLLFMTGYSLLEDESDKHIQHIDETIDENLKDFGK
ncbi:hypothetical protein [Peribacillus loiseleuriae]|uniref:hypothetical protein n=1 Tax=Peribacillus loiseleuriae TaxID=1679170 RepID=UPI003CFDDCB4